MLDFCVSTRLVCGKDALSALGEYRGQKALLVTDPYFMKNGTAQQLLGSFSSDSRCFSEITAEPTVELAAKGAKLLQELNPRLLLALGGGSAMDCAKGMLAASGLCPIFIAIPTTSGTGSEVTSFTILSHDGIKKVLVEKSLRPQIAILDDSLLAEMPPSVIADSGMDTLSHAIEAAAAKNASPFSNALAVSALRSVLRLLPLSFRGDRSVRGELHCAACMAGLAFDHAGLGACHALSHALGGRYHLPHGKLNAILLPAVLEYNRETHPELYTSLGAACSLSSSRGLIFAIRRLRQELRLPQSLSAAGLSRQTVIEDLPRLCATAMADPCSLQNPRTPSEGDYAALLRKCL